MGDPPSAWTCVNDCDAGSSPEAPLPPWRRGFALAVMVASAVAVCALPLLLRRSASVFQLYVRQPVTLAFLCAGLMASMVVPYNGEPQGARQRVRVKRATRTISAPSWEARRESIALESHDILLVT